MGSTLPRPRIYTDVKHSVERVDPPVPVMDPFLSWANEAHWSMGGLNFNRLRYQDGQKERNKKRGGSVSPPPAPKVAKKRRFLQLIDEESEEEEDQEIEETVKVKRGFLRRLGEWEKKSRGGKKDKQSGGESGSEAVSGGIRSSPRLAKRRSNFPFPYLQTNAMELAIGGSCKGLLCLVNIPNSATMDQNFHLEIVLWNPTASW
ncbi:hypothetical protein OIU79_024406 [Salix purpurea]|uniref:Uncharacterized protein n=1 Tax=Salix purpurea TaxID=77065 RepID=A0A9Q1AAE8_SALPP|nr:hypothetical protein OIU79_024406 [Salix purpurea]